MVIAFLEGKINEIFLTLSDPWLGCHTQYTKTQHLKVMQLNHEYKIILKNLHNPLLNKILEGHPASDGGLLNSTVCFWTFPSTNQIAELSGFLVTETD